MKQGSPTFLSPLTLCPKALYGWSDHTHPPWCGEPQEKRVRGDGPGSSGQARAVQKPLSELPCCPEPQQLLLAWSSAVTDLPPALTPALPLALYLRPGDLLVSCLSHPIGAVAAPGLGKWTADAFCEDWLVWWVRLVQGTLLYSSTFYFSDGTPLEYNGFSFAIYLLCLLFGLLEVTETFAAAQEAKTQWS